MTQQFKADQFATDILKKREKEGFVYSKAKEVIGVQASVLHRAESGLPVSLESFALICNWLGKKVQNYF